MLFFTGSYTDRGGPAHQPQGLGITSCFFDSTNGTIKISGSTFQKNPSYPILSKDKKVLYAANETFATEEPQLVAYSVNEDGSLSQLNAVPLKGDFSCHMAIAGQSLIIANYVSGDILVYSLRPTGEIDRLCQQIFHEGSGPNKERQEAPHPHMIFPVNDSFFYCVDLGIDAAKAYGCDSASQKWKPLPEHDIKVKAGAGARHMDTYGEWIALLGELSGELFLYRRTADSFQLIDVASLDEGAMDTAAIRFHPNGKFIYCSDRKTNCIHGYMIAENKLNPIGKIVSGGKTPRDISIDSTGKWLLAANQNSNTIAVFSIDYITGALQYINMYIVMTPSAICW
jgi:6-phosphogluconolactonase